jgi:hypothetical protein
VCDENYGCWGCSIAAQREKRPPRSSASPDPPSNGTSPIFARADFRKGGLDGLWKRTPRYRPIRELAAHTDIIRQSLEKQPARTIAEACQRVAELTGVIRKPTQVRRFLKGLGLKWQRVRAIPVPPKKT